MRDELPSAKDNIQLLFRLMGIDRVVVVDDVFSASPDSDSIVGQCRAMIAAGKKEVLPTLPQLTALKVDTDDEQVIIRQVRGSIDSLQADQRKALAVRLADLMGQDHGEEKTLTELQELLAGYNIQLLSGPEWESKKPELLKDGMRESTIFLFDQDFSPAGGHATQGMDVIAGLMNDASAEGILCGLLTHTVAGDREFEAWNALAESNNIVPHKDRFTVIAKTHLQNDPTAFVARVKRVAITGKCDALKRATATSLSGAHKEAERSLNEMNVFDFEQIVFQSSYLEGVWEPDTLFRVFALFHRRAARALAKKDTTIRKLADDVRRVIQIPYRPEDAPQSTSWKIQRLEIFEDGDFLNGHLSPIELGDVFQRTTGKKRFILLGPPCDLMVRSNGNRGGTKAVVLAEITAKDPQGKEGFYKIPYYGEEDGKPGWVKFRETAAIQICILDLCAVQTDGVSRISRDEAAPSGLIPAWRARHAILKDEASNIVERFELMKKKLPSGSADIEKVLSASLTGSVSGIVNGAIDIREKTVAYDIKRIGRVKGPAATALLKAYALYLSRDAFEHSLTTAIHSEATSTGCVEVPTTGDQ